MSWRSPSTNAGEAAGDAHDRTPRSSLNVEQQIGASAIPFQVPTSTAAQQKPKIESSLFTRELWLSASHILREFAPLQHLATRKEDEEANDDDSDEEDGWGQGRSSGFEGEHKKLLLVMVGLPARGKSFIAHRLTNYLTWYGLRTRVFNVGAYRRAVGGNEDAEFFDASNKDAAATREQLAWTVFAELMLWLVSGRGDVGIFDATNTTGVTPPTRKPVACAPYRPLRFIPHCPPLSLSPFAVIRFCTHKKVQQKAAASQHVLDQHNYGPTLCPPRSLFSSSPSFLLHSTCFLLLPRPLICRRATQTNS